MAKVVVRLAGKDLFNWTGSKAKIANLEKRLAAAAASVGKTVTELINLLLEATFAQQGLLADSASREMQVAGLIHYLLDMPTGRPERPGTHRDYVIAGWDFMFDLYPEQPGRGRIEVSSRADW